MSQTELRILIDSKAITIYFIQIQYRALGLRLGVAISYGRELESLFCSISLEGACVLTDLLLNFWQDD